MALKIRMLTSQSGPRVSRAFGQIVDVASGEMDPGEARRLVDAGSAEISEGSFSRATKTKAKPKPETAAVVASENAAKRTGTAPRRQGRPRKRKKKETSS